MGKSSTINTILRNKKVSVSATPGHTKHFQVQEYSFYHSVCQLLHSILGTPKIWLVLPHVFMPQTLYVEPDLCLCDCPGLVMPSFVSTKAEMICSGILPIDQMRDHVPAVSLISFWIKLYFSLGKNNSSMRLVKLISDQALTIPLHMSNYTPACTWRHLRHQYHPTTRGRWPWQASHLWGAADVLWM